MRTAGHTATQIGHATTLITKAATQRLAIPAAKSGGRALGKLLLLPFRLLAKVSPKAQVTIVVLAAIGVGGFLYWEKITTTVQRGAQVVTPSRGSLPPSSPSSPSSPQGAQPAQPTPPSLGWSQSPPTRFNRLQMNVVRFAFLARPGEPDRRISHYMVSIDGGMPERVEQPRTGHATWGPLPRGLPGGQHTIQVVAYDDRGTASSPITATFSTPALAEEIIDNAPRRPRAP